MKQCELERVIREKGNPKLKRTGEKKVTFIDGIGEVLEGAIIELKKSTAMWVVDKIHDQEISLHQLKRNWSVSDIS